MARFFAINGLAGLFRSNTDVGETTTAGHFDSAYVNSAFQIANDGVDYAMNQAPFLDGSSSISGRFWLRFDCYPQISSGGPLAELWAGGGAKYRINYTTGSTAQFQYWNGSTWTGWGSTFAVLTSGANHTVVLDLTPQTGFNLYVGGTLVASDGGVTPTGSSTGINRFQWYSNSSSPGGFSQIMCADYDLRSSHLMAVTLNGNSAVNTGGTGSYTDVSETGLDESTAEIIATVGNKMGQTHAAITVPSGLGISAIVINARGRVSGGVVTDGKLGVRSGSTNSSSAALSFGGGYEPRSAIWETDPNTSGAWTQTSFNAAETYLEAA